MKIHFLGTGSAYPSAERDNTSLCLTHNDTHILIDVSGNPCQKLKKIGVGLRDLDSVIFTHFHIDHIYGLPSLLWGMWLENRERQLTIYCHLANEAKLNNWLDTMEITQWGIKFPIHIRTFNGQHEEEILAYDGLSISCFPAIHSVPTTGLEVNYDDKRIIYSGDTQINTHINKYQHIDILIHEATSSGDLTENHSSITEIVEVYELNKISNIVLVHLSDNEPYDEVITRLGVNDKIRVAQALMSITI